MYFQAKEPASLKFSLPMKGDGTIATGEDTATGYKQFTLKAIKNVGTGAEHVASWNAANYFIEKFIDDIFNTTHDEYANKIAVEYESVGD